METFNTMDSVYHTKVSADDGEIKDYDLVLGMNKPAILLDIEKVETLVIKVLFGICNKTSVVGAELPPSSYNVYIRQGGTLMCVGYTHSDNLKSILKGDIFKNMSKTLYMADGDRIEGDLMLAFCTSPSY